MHVLLLGASRNIGFFVAQRLLAQGHTCTLLLRRLEAMQSEPSMTNYVQSGQAKLVGGDALIRADVQRAWDTAKGNGEVDAVFFGIGGEPSFSLTKGAVINPPDLTARGISVLLDVIQSSTSAANRPKLVTITSNGLDDDSHSMLPGPMRMFYGWALRLPHEDKIEHEKNVNRATGADGSGAGWMPVENVTIVRPAYLTDGECKADRKVEAYRVGTSLEKVWTINRADVAHFIAERVFTDWAKWGGKAWVVGY
ncbi:NAD(P)H-binding family protein [Ceratobasidium sp. AG-Ba]|nr:NAD(P)H-binding family protein [Ceratobasidium sp. AG-Ba]QRW09274.1 NAD(P)H-binding family protein [Ceratobasidium sp. AG-Ba]